MPNPSDHRSRSSAGSWISSSLRSLYAIKAQQHDLFLRFCFLPFSSAALRSIRSLRKPSQPSQTRSRSAKCAAPYIQGAVSRSNPPLLLVFTTINTSLLINRMEIRLTRSCPYRSAKNQRTAGPLSYLIMDILPQANIGRLNATSDMSSRSRSPATSFLNRTIAATAAPKASLLPAAATAIPATQSTH